jgi:AcrR family transcriptional regulator
MTKERSVDSDQSPPRRKPVKRATGKASPVGSQPVPADKQPARKPHGREEVVDSIINATLSLWTAQGPAELSMRSIASRAGVNYGLVHRHFGTKDAVIRATMERVVLRSLEFIQGSDNLQSAVERILPLSTGAHARLVAWATLQYVLDDVLPEDDVFLKAMRELALRDRASSASDGLLPEEATAATVRVGSLIAMLYGWRLFEPYLLRGLGLEDLDQAELGRYIRDDMMRVLGVED